jgi:hypothetical protein
MLRLLDRGRDLLAELWRTRRVRHGIVNTMGIAPGFELNCATGEWRQVWGPAYRPPQTEDSLDGTAWDRPPS